MSYFEDEKIDKIAHHIESISKEMYQVKKAVLEEKIAKDKLAKKDKRRLDSLKKAQKKFKNVSTNFKAEEFAKIENRLKELKINASTYIKQLIDIDLAKHIIVK